MVEVMPEHPSQSEALTMRLLAGAPLRWRIMSCVYNRKCEAVLERVLSQRNAAMVSESWRGSAVEERFRLSVSDLIAKHLRWSKPLFVPQDECFVLFRSWQRGIADCMERESFVMELESRLGLDIPDHLRLSLMTYGELLGVLTALDRKAANGNDQAGEENGPGPILTR